MKIIIAMLFMVSYVGFTQETELNKYLNALKTSEFDESKKVVSDYTFSNSNKYTLSKVIDVSGIESQTDVDGVKAYKAIVVAYARNKAGGFIETRFLAIMYFDKVDKRWKLFDLREAADPCSEATISEEEVSKGEFYTDKQYVYRNMAYWLLMCGKLKNARLSTGTAIEAALLKHDQNFVITYNQILDRIM